jgi:hypothetical protein
MKLAPAGGPRLTHTGYVAVSALAVVLLLAGAALLIWGGVNAGIAFALVGTALVAIEQLDKRRTL